MFCIISYHCVLVNKNERHKEAVPKRILYHYSIKKAGFL